MKFLIYDDNNFKITINNTYIDFKYDNEEELYENLKNILISIKKKHAFDIYGFYEVNIYTIKNICTILEFSKKDDNHLYKTIDLKIIKNTNKNVYLKFDDYFLIKEYKKVKYLKNKYYINVDKLKECDINKLLEHFEVVIDERLNDISYINYL